MATWIGAIVETKGRADFWSLAARHGVVPANQVQVPQRALLDCGGSYSAAVRLSRALSRELDSTCIGFAIQTTVDGHETFVFERGTQVRHLAYLRDDGGWGDVKGTPQPWEPTYFFGGDHMASDELSDAELARYAAAKEKGEPSAVMDLLAPSSGLPMWGVCKSLGIDPQVPDGRWRSFWARLFGR